jgi:hypothetical protein
MDFEPRSMMSQTRMMGRDAEAMLHPTSSMPKPLRSTTYESVREARPTARPLIDLPLPFFALMIGLPRLWSPLIGP